MRLLSLMYEKVNMCVYFCFFSQEISGLLQTSIAWCNKWFCLNTLFSTRGNEASSHFFSLFLFKTNIYKIWLQQQYLYNIYTSSFPSPYGLWLWRGSLITLLLPLSSWVSWAFNDSGSWATGAEKEQVEMEITCITVCGWSCWKTANYFCKCRKEIGKRNWEQLRSIEYIDPRIKLASQKVWVALSEIKISRGGQTKSGLSNLMLLTMMHTIHLHRFTLD